MPIYHAINKSRYSLRLGHANYDVGRASCITAVLVPTRGIEPRLPVLQTGVIPLDQEGILGCDVRFELTLANSQFAVLPLHQKHHSLKIGRVLGSRTRSSSL